MHDLRETVGDVVGSYDPPCLPRKATVLEAIEMMREQDGHGVLVTDGDRVVGIFTERDLLCQVATPEFVAADTLLEDVMSVDPIVLNKDACVSYAINRMGLRGFSHIPVVDPVGRPVALLAVRDVMAHLAGVLDELAAPAMDDAVSSPWIDIGGG